MTQMIDAGQNPDLVNSLVSSAVADTPAAVEEMPTIQPPPDGAITLQAGIVNQLDGTVVNDAVVRELTGADEEALAAPAVMRSISRYIQAIVGRGTVSIGGAKPTSEQFDSLLIGDRELLLLGIRKATYGPKMELVTRCPHCEDVDENFVYDLNDVEVRKLERLEDAIYGFDVELPSGKTARVILPRAVDQDSLLTSDKNLAELDTLMLSKCVQKLDGEMVLSDKQVRNLAVRDRRELLKQINERTPGPRVGEAKRTCGACEQEFDLGIGLLDTFRA